ncbi:MAG: RNA polymerase sigma factor [Flavobacteriales bacterium]|nr:RNA polymerase sigma factor [Flavobacteriales bacterium]
MTTAEFRDNVLPLKNKLYGLAYRLLYDVEDARDTVQEVMMKLWEAGKPLEEIENLEAWSMTMVRNRSLDRIRTTQLKHKHHRELRVVTEGHYVPADRLEEEEKIKAVHKFMQELPVIQRELLELRDFQDKTYDEMATITGLDLQQVKVYLHRARKSIREKIENLHAYGI